MSDQEWKSWQAAFQQKASPLPAIAQGARRAQRRIWLARAGVVVIATTELAFGVFLVCQRGEDAFIFNLCGLAILAMMAGFTAWYVQNQRGILRGARAAAADQLAFMESSIAAAERAAAFGRFFGVVVCGFTLVFNVAVWMRELPPWWLMALSLAFIGAVFAGTWMAPVRAVKKLAPRRAQLAQWRAELEQP